MRVYKRDEIRSLGPQRPRETYFDKYTRSPWTLAELILNRPEGVDADRIVEWLMSPVEEETR